MKKKSIYLLLICYIFYSAIALGQSPYQVDSINSILSGQNGAVLANNLNELSWQYRKVNDSLAMVYAQKAEKIADFIQDTLELATSYIRQGTLLLNNKKYKETEVKLKKALQLEQLSENISGIARAKNQLGKLYKKKGDYEKALQYYQEALDIHKTNGNQEKLARVYNNMASLYETMDMARQAINYYHKSIDVRENLGDIHQLLNSYYNLGNFYNQLGMYQNALMMLEKSKKLCHQKKDVVKLSSVFLDIGFAYQYLQQIDSARVYYEKSRVLHEKLNLKGKYNVYNSLGLVYSEQGNFETAKNLFDKSINAALKSNEQEKLLRPYFNLGNLFRKMDQSQKALAYHQKALALSRQFKDNQMRLKILISIAEVYEQLGNYKEASLYNESHIVLRDSMDIQTLSIVDLEISREKRKTLEYQNQLIKNKSEQKNLIIIGLISGCILLSILFFMFFRTYRLKKRNEIVLQNEKINQSKIEELLKNQELKSIHAMINGQEKERKRIAQDLHDRLGSMLSVVKIHYKSVEEDLEKLKTDSKSQYEKANQLLDEACVAVREISHDMVSGVLTKFGLIPALQELTTNVENASQLKIELISFGFDHRVNNEIEINIYRILQELIGNILKHARAEEISIQLLKKEDSIAITVIDDGIGFDPDYIQNFSGMGIKGIRSRIENMKGNLDFDSGKGNGTTVTMYIPINRETKHYDTL
ncbi:tetratricopeptide repeat-containing sensor histidine kinase [Aquimarina pacifica]|uniref:tetratricopeptide repeat-containing sensor histidine kinase n=1 Tax=Aquimarina pacifica TaxID=1296415 RepID=UPI0013768D1D|nr:tetratricopeptide repeat protein [Aquimarina pacifica]